MFGASCVGYMLICLSAADGLEKLHLATVFHVPSAGYWE